ncbi:glycoside hydrolase family 31 protein [Serendipita vermifera MAFF 305830]|uniref:Probable alpha/beta-glucosidase agdC n=1 Tax=Serendipita vermifera MAFF 305830 TaxID=933852 RepID=A0A0C2WWD5_SERVB|nr:glycoside hydrolase family 31 protein [Serendipita vermifera MAFF 305830]
MKKLSRFATLFLSFGCISTLVRAASVLDACPGYNAENVQVTHSSLTADLVLAGEPCAIYGQELPKLSLHVEYQTDSRIRVKITDPRETRYEVPEQVVPRPRAEQAPTQTLINFRFTSSPFSFSIVRTDTKETLFDTVGHALIFSPQYLRLKTSLPLNANIYGLGEHTESFRLDPENTTRTLWTRDSMRIPPGTNLYGAHPVYFEQRTTGTHGVLLLNSNGMDIKLNQGEQRGSLEYNVIGGMLDLYFFTGATPVEVAKQYAEIIGRPAEVPYWSFGLHQCRFGYKDINEVVQVVANYSTAGIPLETMWIDIDYMDDRLIFTTDPEAYPKDKLRLLIKDLHEKDQHFVMMVDPAVGTRAGQQATYDRGSEADVWLKGPDGKPHIGIVWPGTTVFPDWFHPSANSFWAKEFELFFNPADGFDIDGVWIDMNEPASFCYHPCKAEINKVNVTEIMLTLGNVPPLDPTLDQDEVDGVNLQRPPYAIRNDLPRLSDRTAPVDAVHHNGLLEYDTHNLYGSMMSVATREAMLARKPTLRPFVITRSTFAGIGAKVGKWLGDNASEWAHYRFSIAGMLGFASIYQVPMVGSDVCGFVDNTTEPLCARWAMLGAFSPFYRNHNDIASIPQEFYRWPVVAKAAKAAIEIRYKLLDYLYTAFHKAHLDGTPVVQPLFFAYSNDEQTFGIEHQFLFGDAIMVAPVLDEGNKVEIYLPMDIFYEFGTRKMISGPGAKLWVKEVELHEIPLLIRGGKIIPMRVESAMTTKGLRQKDFEIVVAPGLLGLATGSLYLDDGVSLEQEATLEVLYAFDGTKLFVTPTGSFNAGVQYSKIAILGVDESPGFLKLTWSDGRILQTKNFKWSADTEVLDLEMSIPLNEKFTLELVWEDFEYHSGKEQVPLHDEL